MLIRSPNQRASNPVSNSVDRSGLRSGFPVADSVRPVLVTPELQSANVAYKLIWRLAGAEAIGPVLLGMAKPIHVLQAGLEVSDIVNMTALCVVDAQEAAGPGNGWNRTAVPG